MSSIEIPKQKIYIYERKEMVVLSLLGLVIGLFAFTLGVHLGKRVALKSIQTSEHGPVPTMETQVDKAPNRQEATELSAGVPQAVDEVLDQNLHEEVTKTGLKADRYRPVDLDEKSKDLEKSAHVGDANQNGKRAKLLLTLKMIAASSRSTPEGEFTLQVGSHSDLEEAKDQIDALEAVDLKPYLREVSQTTQKTWYKVYLGGFVTKDEAEEVGARYRAKNFIDSFVVTKIDF